MRKRIRGTLSVDNRTFKEKIRIPIEMQSRWIRAAAKKII